MKVQGYFCQAKEIYLTNNILKFCGDRFVFAKVRDQIGKQTYGQKKLLLLDLKKIKTGQP